MPYAFIQDVPIGEDVYKKIRERMGEEPMEGLIVHVVQKTEAGLRYIDVWESQAAAERAVDERIHPAVGPVLAAMGINAPEPEKRLIDVIEVWPGTASSTLIVRGDAHSNRH